MQDISQIYTAEIFLNLVIPHFILEKEMATHSSILAWEILWTKEPAGLQSMQLQRVQRSRATNTFILYLYCYYFKLP